MRTCNMIKRIQSTSRTRQASHSTLLSDQSKYAFFRRAIKTQKS